MLTVVDDVRKTAPAGVLHHDDGFALERIAVTRRQDADDVRMAQVADARLGAEAFQLRFDVLDAAVQLFDGHPTAAVRSTAAADDAEVDGAKATGTDRRSDGSDVADVGGAQLERQKRRNGGGDD